MFKCVHCDFKTNKISKLTRHINRKIPCSKSMKQERQQKQGNSNVDQLASEFARNSLTHPEIGVEPSINRVNMYDDDSDYTHPPEGMEKCTWELDLFNEILKCVVFNLGAFQHKHFREVESIEEETKRSREFQNIFLPLRCIGDVQFWRRINREAKKQYEE